MGSTLVKSNCIYYEWQLKTGSETEICSPKMKVPVTQHGLQGKEATAQPADLTSSEEFLSTNAFNAIPHPGPSK